MHSDFWHQKWQKNEIGFHLSEANPLFIKNLPALQLPANSRVFVPLCGKTLDIAWLLQHGYRVAGAELSEAAVKALFEQLQLTPNFTPLGALTRYSAPNIDIFVGDIFALSPELLGNVDAVYDRAALVALPPEMRTRYTVHLRQLTHTAPQLLICFDYDQTLHDGPPFCVNTVEIHRHYGEHYTITLLQSTALAGGLKGQYPAWEQVWHLY